MHSVLFLPAYVLCPVLNLSIPTRALRHCNRTDFFFRASATGGSDNGIKGPARRRAPPLAHVSRVCRFRDRGHRGDPGVFRSAGQRM